MTNREYLEGTIKALEELNALLDIIESYSSYSSYLGEIDDETDHIETILRHLPSAQTVKTSISAIRHNFAKTYNNYLWRNFYAFVKRFTIDFTDENDVYVCDKDKIAIRQDDYAYYIVKILNPDEYMHGVLLIEGHDDFPLHQYPKEYTRYRYPELAMIGHLINRDVEWANSEI